MMLRTQQRRTGAYVVEFAFVAAILVLFLFGVFEYCRYLFVKQVIHASAREGARYAVVNTTTTNLVTNTQNQVLKRMSGLDKVPKCNYQCQVYLADNAGNNIGNAADAGFGQYIAVQID
ncbi:MAG: pilus assembly protein, partial [Gemmataceae bacterium]|nr:pilus assembly protein [Gemmataceae bacterium]